MGLPGTGGDGPAGGGLSGSGGEEGGDRTGGGGAAGPSCCSWSMELGDEGERAVRVCEEVHRCGAQRRH